MYPLHKNKAVNNLLKSMTKKDIFRAIKFCIKYEIK